MRRTQAENKLEFIIFITSQTQLPENGTFELGYGLTSRTTGTGTASKSYPWETLCI
jgi:hypothetical protein